MPCTSRERETTWQCRKKLGVTLSDLYCCMFKQLDVSLKITWRRLLLQPSAQEAKLGEAGKPGGHADLRQSSSDSDLWFIRILRREESTTKELKKTLVTQRGNYHVAAEVLERWGSETLSLHRPT